MTTPDLRSALERIAAKVTEVIEDSESQHPGGWGPDVTTVAVLREARDDLLDLRAAQPEPLDVENATERERLAYGRGWNKKAIDGSHVPGSESER